MDKQLKAVAEFHQTFKQGDTDMPKPSFTHADIYLLRHRLMEEENNEYLDACLNGNLEGIADALGDQLYILCGTILKHGLQDKIVEIFDEIQRSNMSKLGEDGQPIFREDGKIL